MAMNSGRSGLPAADSPLDARACADIGAELSRVRADRGLTFAQVGEQLLLSKRQVQALEEGDCTAFHNPTFHLKALRKYVVFAGIDATLLNRVAAAVARPEPVLSAADADEPLVDDGSRRGLALVASILLVSVAVAAAGYFLWRREPAASVPGATSVRMEAPPPSRVAVPAVQPAVMPVAELVPVDPSLPTPVGNTAPINLTPSAFGSVRALHPTWIFIRDADNNATEKTLAAGESLEFETQPTYLAVGSADAELTISARQVDLAPFVQNGQIRIRAGDFDALVQGALPIPAPTPAAVR